MLKTSFGNRIKKNDFLGEIILGISIATKCVTSECWTKVIAFLVSLSQDN